MKNFVFLLFWLVFICANAQKHNGHIKFKGIGVKGDVREFVSKLENKGDKVIDVRPGIATLSGTMGGDSCNIFVLSSSRNVFEVVVSYPNDSVWGRIEEQYNRIKEKLHLKYGDSAEIITTGEYSGLSDADKMASLIKNDDKCKTTFELASGSIILSIDKYDDKSGQVNLIYRDRKNYQPKGTSNLDDF